MPKFLKEHIVLKSRTETLPYTSTANPPLGPFIRTGLNRNDHARRLKLSFQEAVKESIAGEDLSFVYVTFESPIDIKLNLESFDIQDYKLCNYHVKTVTDDQDVEHTIYVATVCFNKKGVSTFLKKIEQYNSKNTKIKLNEDGTYKSGGNPYNQLLIANIEKLRAATLKSFWQEPEISFPQSNEQVWWEVWLSKDETENDTINSITQRLSDNNVQVSEYKLEFPEHWVYLMKGNVSELSNCLLYTDRLSELRKPRDLADFFTSLERSEKRELIDDILSRINQATDTNIAVCLLDTGVNRLNPLLTDLIPERHLDAIKPSWTKADGYDFSNGGHGTPMAGLIFYGDLTDNLGNNSVVNIYHHLESIKMVDFNDQHAPSLYGAVTQESVARAEIINKDYKRIVCMAVTTENEHKGRPSAWSSAIDQLIFGSPKKPNGKTLFFVSAGNIQDDPAIRIKYPLSNDGCSVQDPAQAFNAITVGAYTLKDFIDLSVNPEAKILAERGSLSSCSTTSVTWENEWCRKPDIVMEGGNQAREGDDIINITSLQLLSSSKGANWLTYFKDTSAATALASKFAAELYYQYPDYWPETIRGLVIHSADWTPAMLLGRTISGLSRKERLELVSRVGYGVPNMESAKYSANNSLSLIAERTIKPYKKVKSEIKTQDFHLFDLPWTVEELQRLYNTPVRLKITLSYFIEPNPGSKRYELAGSYRSYGLRFKMLDKNEGLTAFKGRISKAMRETPEFKPEGSESWLLQGAIRDKGCVHKDIWEGPAIDLMRRNKIAVYPVGGWWKTRRKLNGKDNTRHENSVRYSLIITIETPTEDVDLYTPVFNQINVPIDVQ